MPPVHPFGDWRPRAVVFDCDGLLVDTEPCWTVAETELFRRRGRGFGPDEKALLIGRSLDHACDELARLFEEPSGAALADELLSLVVGVIDGGVAPMPGAAELIEQIGAVLPIAVASNSPRALLDTTLARSGLRTLVEITIAADEVLLPKPAPDLYVEACRRLSTEPRDALALEDSTTGVRSARAAGMRVVGVPTLASAFDADWVVASLTDPGLGAWFSASSPPGG
jgi:HAD superfamily hydrolase (TIGR01509 family)